MCTSSASRSSCWSPDCQVMKKICVFRWGRSHAVERLRHRDRLGHLALQVHEDRASSSPALPATRGAGLAGTLYCACGKNKLNLQIRDILRGNKRGHLQRNQARGLTENNTRASQEIPHSQKTRTTWSSQKDFREHSKDPKAHRDPKGL